MKLLQKMNLSYAELASLLQLSYTGVINVVDDMINGGILEKKEAETETNARGRPSCIIGINAGKGCVAVVNFCGQDLLSVFDLEGNVLHRVHLEYDYVSEEVIEYLVSRFREIVETELKSPLLAISVIGAGYIDKYTGRFIYAPHIEHYKELNLKDMFAEFTDADVEVKNIMYYRILAERELGDKEITNALLIDDYGSALCLDGKIYEGENGFAGELASLSTDYYMDANEFVAEEYMENAGRLCSSARIMQIIRERLKKGEKSILNTAEDLSMEKILDAYQKDDPLVCEVITANAKLFACTIKNIIGYLNLNTVIFGTERSKFGERYRAEVERLVNKKYQSASVRLSSFPGNAETLGACRAAIGRAYEKILTELA